MALRPDINGMRGNGAERGRAEAELDRRIRQQALVAALGVRALRHGNLRSLMDETVKLVRGALEVDYATIEQVLLSSDGLLVRAGAGWREGVVGRSVIPAGRGSPGGYALLTGEPVIVDDMTAETRFEVPRVLRENDVMSEVAVVIDPRGDPFGTLAALSTNRRSFSEADVSFMQSVANVLATAVHRAHEHERLQAAREAERSRIARDLHDDALRELAGAIALVLVARSTSARQEDQPRWAALLAALKRVDRRLRGAIEELSPTSDERREFAHLLADLIAIQSDMAVDCQVELRGESALPAGSLGHRGTEVLRIVREAIMAARRHAGATMIRVDASASTREVLRLEVSDDGHWPDRDADLRSAGDAGIKGMLERAELLGARLDIEERSGGGRCVRLELPLTGTELRIEALTSRERDVLALIAEGRSNQGIADELAVTVSAVERHVTNIFVKLGLPFRREDHRRVLAALRYTYR